MIGRSNRFHGRASIRRLQQSGQAARSGVFGLRYAANSKAGTYRLTVVVSRKVSKSAVVRNRIRRRLYERVRVLYSSTVAPYDLAIMVYSEQIATMPTDQLDGEVAKLFAKAKLTSAVPAGRAIVEPKEN